MPDSKQQFLEILRVLTRHRVEFIVVGGISAALHGARGSAFDLDVVHRRCQENIARLLSALEEVDAVYRSTPEQNMRPNESILAGPEYHLLITKFGPLDVHGAIGGSRTWADLHQHTQVIPIGPDASVRVLDLETLIEIKEKLGRPKDLAMLPLLRHALERADEENR